MTGVDVGDLAPDFTLRHTMDTSVTLSEAARDHHVLLVFYVFDFGFV